MAFSRVATFCQWVSERSEFARPTAQTLLVLPTHLRNEQKRRRNVSGALAEGISRFQERGHVCEVAFTRPADPAPKTLGTKEKKTVRAESPREGASGRGESRTRESSIFELDERRKH